MPRPAPRLAPVTMATRPASLCGVSVDMGVLLADALERSASAASGKLDAVHLQVTRQRPRRALCRRAAGMLACMPFTDIALWILSIGLMVLGLAGAVLPVLPGAALVLAGAVIGA